MVGVVVWVAWWLALRACCAAFSTPPTASPLHSRLVAGRAVRANGGQMHACNHPSPLLSWPGSRTPSVATPNRTASRIKPRPLAQLDMQPQPDRQPQQAQAVPLAAFAPPRPAGLRGPILKPVQSPSRPSAPHPYARPGQGQGQRQAAPTPPDYQQVAQYVNPRALGGAVRDSLPGLSGRPQLGPMPIDAPDLQKGQAAAAPGFALDMASERCRRHVERLGRASAMRVCERAQPLPDYMRLSHRDPPKTLHKLPSSRPDWGVVMPTAGGGASSSTQPAASASAFPSP